MMCAINWVHYGPNPNIVFDFRKLRYPINIIV